MAKRRMKGKIAREDSLAIHSYKSNGTLALFSHWSCKMRHVFPVHIGTLVRMAATRQWKREPECD